jgi:hypothetical protein
MRAFSIIRRRADRGLSTPNLDRSRTDQAHHRLNICSAIYIGHV